MSMPHLPITTTDPFDTAGFRPLDVLESLADGLYITDPERRIVYWNAAATRITGWRPEEVLGRRCLEGLLCHVDKDGRRLCGRESCPLYRSIITGTESPSEILVFGITASGRRIPMRVTTAPLRDAEGRIVGGVETFRDVSAEYADLLRARQAQAVALAHPTLADPRVAVRDLYIPQAYLGGDFHYVEQLDPDHVAFWVGDVMGHGLAPAVYTLQLRALWSEHRDLLDHPEAFMHAVNDRFYQLSFEDGSFATAAFGLVDLGMPAMRLVSAGTPPPLHYRSDGRLEPPLDLGGLPLGVKPDETPESVAVPVDEGDTLLFYTDGAVEVTAPGGKHIGRAGFIALLADLGYPSPGVRLEDVEAALLRASGLIRFADDLTLFEIRLT